MRAGEVTQANDAVSISRYRPLGRVNRISGVRVYDVGQGDAIAVLDENRRPCLWVDYGGRQGNPFMGGKDAPDARMPVLRDDMLMLTHWDEDHWCSAPKGAAALDAIWLVPRQTSSPRAARFSATVADIACIPEAMVGQATEFVTARGDRVRWEKIGPWPGSRTVKEDCNASGVAFSIVRRANAGETVDEVILLPGDAPFDSVGHYADYEQPGFDVVGLVAFHHGAGTHWGRRTEDMVRKFDPDVVVFSCSDPNAYSHPDAARWSGHLPGAAFVTTSELRAQGTKFHDILF